ncbi:MAG: amidohydrolase family protein [Pseudomonadota bacterium]|nr:amidohydrolase family protein [Pseudomonadota bacterium]
MAVDAKKLLAGATLAAGIAVIVVACGGGGDGSNFVDVTKGLVIQNVTVVDTRDGSLKPGMAVVIDAGKIQNITGDRVRLSGSAQSIDGSGKFVVPGFNDMHTHALSTLDNPPGDLPVLLANGVTGVREAGGSPPLIQRAKQLNAGVAAGTTFSPEVLLMPSVIFAGQAPTDPAARQFVRDRKSEGADYIKMVAGPRDAFLAAIDEAKIQGLHSAGHLPLTLSALDASNAGYHSFEHLGSGVGLVLDCASDEPSIRQAMIANPPPPGPNVINPRLYDGNFNAVYYQRIIDSYSDAKCQSLAQAFVKNDTWQAPTLIRLRTQDFGDDASYRNDANLIYVDKTRRALWESIAQQFATTITPSTRATLQQYYALQIKVVKLLKQTGVKMMAGTDLGGGLVIPGFSLHQEFKELAAAGLSPLEVLQMTTLNAAQFLHREATMGTVEAGKNADLVVLDANPIAAVANLDRISAVVSKGKYLSRVNLDQLLRDVAAQNAAQPVKALETALDPTHTD